MYIDLLKFERDPLEADGAIVYKAENFRLRFDVQEPPVEREDFRPVLIDVPSLSELERGLIEREIEYERHRGLTVGTSVLAFRDPSGNWLQVGEFRRVG